MKQRKLVFSIVLLFSLHAGALVFGQTVEKSKTLSRSFAMGSETEIEISNKYGNIHLETWEKDSVRFEIRLSVKGPKQSRVDKTFDYIDFEFQTSKYYIIGKTVFEGNSFWNDVSDLTGTIFSSNTKTKIDYTVYLPADAPLKVVNKYGDIYTTDLGGEISIELSNGDLKAHHLSGKTTIKTDFGNSDINQIDEGRLSVNYGEFYLEKGININIQSKSSELHFQDVDDLQVDSKRDKYFVQNVASIRGTTYFSRINIDRAGKQFDLNTKYGDVDVKSFSDGFTSFTIKANDSDVRLHFTDNKQYNVDIVADKETEVYYSSGIENIKSDAIKGDEKLIRVNCVVGNNSGMSVPIKIDSRAGSLSLKRK